MGGGEGESTSLQQVPGRVEVGRGGWRWWRREGVDLLRDNSHKCAAEHMIVNSQETTHAHLSFCPSMWTSSHVSGILIHLCSYS